MKSFSTIISLAVLLLLGLTQAAETKIYDSTHTKTFGSHKYHGFPGLNTEASAGLGTGFAILGILMIFSCVKIILEEVFKHKDQSQKMIDAHQKMRDLGLNIQEIDAEYDEQLLYRGKDEDQIAKIKAKRAKASGNHVDHANEHGERV